MADLEDMTPGQILADTSVANFIRDLGLGVAAAQKALDENSLATALELATTRPEFSNRSLLELGFNPTFYHYQHADLEVSLQISMRVERSTSVRVGLTASVGHNQSNSTAGSGTATITVRTGTGAPATGVVRLSQPGTAQLVTGATTVQIVNGAATDPNVSVVANSLSRTARALATQLERTDPSDTVPEIRRATVELVAGGEAITPVTDASSVFTVGPNRIEINASPARGARAWVTVTGAGTINLIGGDNVPYTATPNAPTAATAAIEAHASYNATLMFRDGKSLVNPRFVHNSSEQFEPADDENRMLPWIDFLRATGQRVRVVGHADQSGEDARNDPLSRDRATKVRRYLIDHGVPEAQLAAIETADARGEREPINNRPNQRDHDNRRVELHLTESGTTNVVFIEAQTPGVGSTWGADRPSFSANAGRRLGSQDGANAVTFTNGTHVQVRDRFYYVNERPANGVQEPNSVVTMGATAETGARALADSILQNGQIDAVAEGRVVRLFPTGSHALIRMETLTRNTSANTLTLTATGSLSVESPFSGASSAAEANAGDTIRIGSTTLTLRTGTTASTNEFLKGTNAAGTATNLATAISAISGFSGAASNDRVTITGPAGTSLTTSNAPAFELSGAQLSGSNNGNANPPTVPRQEQNTTVAAGLSLDVAYSRRFGLDITGNSRIATRLVSIPAPVELLDEIRTFLNGNPSRPS